MDEQPHDSTTVIKMLQDFKSDSYRRNSGVSMRLSSAGGLSPRGEQTLSRHLTCSSSEIHDDYEPAAKRKKKPDSSYTAAIGSPKQEQQERQSSGMMVVVGTPWEWQRLKGELVSLNTRLSHTEATVEQLDKIRREQEQIFEKEKNILIMKNELDKQMIKQLELRLEAARNNIHEAREAQRDAETELYKMKTKMEQKLATCLNENLKLRENIVVVGDQIDSSDVVPCLSRHLEPDDDHRDHNSDDNQTKLQAAEKRILELEQKLKENLSHVQEFELQQINLEHAKMKIDKLESERALWEEGKLFLSRAGRANELEKELEIAKAQIIRLDQAVQGKLLLEEQLSNMESRLKHTEEVEEQLAQLEVKCEGLISRLHEYESIGIGTNPNALKREVYRLQQAEAILMLEEGKLRSQVDALQRENDSLQRKYEEAKKMATDLTTSTEKLNKFIMRLQKKMLLVSRERDNYRQQLDLVEQEMMTSSGGGGDGDHSSNNNHTLTTERISTLERTCENYRDLIDKLEAELMTRENHPQIQNYDHNEECKKLKEQVDKLKGELEHRVLKGDFNINNTRILHFKMNPAAIACQQAEEKQKTLVQEVEELRAALVQVGLPETMTVTATATATPTTASTILPLGSLSRHAQEITELKKSHEIKIARLKEAFRVSSQEYRQACYLLFGWRIDRIKEGRYKLSSQYAESPDDFLFFDVGEEVNLLETRFSANLGEFITRHLEIEHSVPMFINAVQNELFSQQTMMTTRSSY